MFQVGDKVVHPMHGAGTIDSVVTEKIQGTAEEYYVIRMYTGGLVVKIPTSASEASGLRDVVCPSEAERLMDALSTLEVTMTNNWNHRYRENMLRLKSGDLYEVARVIKGLYRRNSQRGLSNGERKMLHTAKQILISELVIAMGQDYQTVEDRLNVAMSGVKAG